MYRYLKQQETLQSSLEIQNLKSSKCSSSPHPYQTSEQKIPGKLQEVPPNLQYIQHFPYQVWNCDDIGFYTNGNWINIVWTCNLFMSERLWRKHTGKIAPFWCTYLIYNRADGQCFTPPVLVQQITHYTQDIHYNIPSDGVIHNSP